jgi:HrpA-like RNA helicase
LFGNIDFVGKLEAQSDFAKSKSLKEQREFLPVYSIRYDLLNVIRENNVVVIVGIYIDFFFDFK